MDPQHRYCIIMAGGIGSRFWPMSRTTRPKQFHDILGTGRTLLQMTFDRMRRITDPERIYVVTNRDYAGLVKEQLPEIGDDQVLSEPMRRNTAPCVAYAAHKIHGFDPKACLVVAPSDHLIEKEDAFLGTLETAMDRANEEDRLVTLGIKPTRPDTGYGYIQFEGGSNEEGAVRKVLAFTEKPDEEKAKEFLERGDHYWNSGIFIWHVRSILKAFREQLPELDSVFSDGADALNGPREQEFIEQAYRNCQDISVDHGIMEKVDNVDVVLADIGWSDLGTWGALHELMEKDENGNAVVGEKAMLYDTKGSIVQVPDEKLVVLQGLEDMIVVESDDILLVCPKADEQKIKGFVEDVKHQNGEGHV
jgi:mannose-1-phosphate guanylyltransferase